MKEKSEHDQDMVVYMLARSNFFLNVSGPYAPLDIKITFCKLQTIKNNTLC